MRSSRPLRKALGDEENGARECRRPLFSVTTTLVDKRVGGASEGQNGCFSTLL